MWLLGFHILILIILYGLVTNIMGSLLVEGVNMQSCETCDSGSTMLQDLKNFSFGNIAFSMSLVVSSVNCECKVPFGCLDGSF